MNDNEKRERLMDLLENQYDRCHDHEYEIPHTCYGYLSEGGLVEKANYTYILQAFNEKKGVRSYTLYGAHTLVVDLDTINDDDAATLIGYINAMDDYPVLDDDTYNELVHEALIAFCQETFGTASAEKAATIIYEKHAIDIAYDHDDVYVEDNIIDDIKKELHIIA